MKNVGNSSRGRSQGVMNFFRAPYRAHCAVIFATAQLSCLVLALSLRATASWQQLSQAFFDQSRPIGEWWCRVG